MAGLKDYQISVYVANLGKYVEGVLQGAWITLPMPAERLQDTLKTEVGLGGRYEEYAIHDYEGGEGLLATVANPGEYESLTDLNLMCRAFEAREDDDPDVYEKVQTVRDDLDAVPRTPLQYANLALNSDENPYHSYDAPSSAESKEAKYAWTAVNHGWASDAVWSMFDTGLGYLIDMEMYGRDLKLDGDVSLGDNGYLEDADWPSDIDGRYSRSPRRSNGWMISTRRPVRRPRSTSPRSSSRANASRTTRFPAPARTGEPPHTSASWRRVPPISMPRLRTRCTGSSTRAPLLATPWTCCARPWAQCPQRPSAKTTA